MIWRHAHNTGAAAELRRETIRINFERTEVPAITVHGIPICLNPGFLRIASIIDDWRFSITEPEQIAAEVKASGLGAHIFTFAQRLPLTQPMFSYPFRLDNLAAVPLSGYDDWWRKQASDTARNKIRKARRMGVDVRMVDYDEALVRGIESIYNESPIRQGKAFAHYKRSFEELWQIHETYLDRAVFFGAFFKDELIAFAKLVDVGPYIRTMGLLSKIAHRAAAPNNALIDAAVKFCCERTADFLVYGEFDWGNRGSTGLTDFKIEHGFQKMMLPRYYVPLTVRGRLIVRAGLERGFVDKLPGGVIRRLMRARRIMIELKTKFSARR